MRYPTPTQTNNPHCQTSSCQDSGILASDFTDPSGGQQSEDDTEDNNPEGGDQPSAAGRNGTATGGTEGTKKNGKGNTKVTSAAGKKAVNLELVVIAMMIVMLSCM
jgi:hypothetical protein